MIHEIATLSIDPARALAFRDAVALAKPLFLAAKGCHDMRLEQVIETPGQYLLMVRWTTVEDHEAFRRTAAFQEWRGHAGPFFTKPPEVVHVTQIV
ncbi:antibiotic biosynthesis monooxygenase family protein [Paracoccus sp. Ld10]|uniref:antibiotic biosynthesis monooxygenase family protein n=1 Tax=Paracoccus sp. Ld10 TaxID=649158 RepID=UPI003869D79C